MLLGQENSGKSDSGSLIAMLLIPLAVVAWLWYSAPSQEELAEQKRLEAQAEKDKQQPEDKTVDLEKIILDTISGDSTINVELLKKHGDFAYSFTLPSATDNGQTVIENELVKITVSNKGGAPSQVELKEYKTYSKNPLYIVKDKNASFNTVFATSDGRTVNTEGMYFEPQLSKEGEDQVLTMRLKTSVDSYLEYRYVLKPDQYMLDYTISSKGLANTFAQKPNFAIDWAIDAFHTEKGLKYENQYTYLTFAEGAKNKVDNLSPGGESEETVEDMSWFAFRQQFFSTILLPKGEHKATLTSSILEDSLYTKRFTANMILEQQQGDINYPMQLYFGPNQFHLLSQYGKNIDEIVPLGWGIFGWINRWAVIPMFDVLFHSWGMAMWLVILIMTVVLKLVLFPLTYSGYKSTAKMRLLRPEMDEINEKFKKADPAKKQQATMELYNKAGVNPLAGCFPMLLQMPILIAMYRFFPASIELRGQSFLWAEDLSAYDSLITLPFNIPLYGAHVSIFALIMAGTILLQTKMNGGGMDTPQQPGMPNMKFLLYMMPVMMILWFNTAASGLSYYYAASTIISIFQLWFIKKFVINEAKLHARIQENKQKVKKPSKFQQKLDQMMKEAEDSKNRQQRRSK